MSGYATLVFACAACSGHATANPLLVPSLRVSWNGQQYVPDEHGKREPICRPCAELVADRVRAGECAGDPATCTPEYFDEAYNTGADERDI